RGDAAVGFGGGGSGQVGVVVAGGHRQEVFAAGEGLFGFDFGAESGFGGAGGTGGFARFARRAWAGRVGAAAGVAVGVGPGGELVEQFIGASDVLQAGRSPPGAVVGAAVGDGAEQRVDRVRLQA